MVNRNMTSDEVRRSFLEFFRKKGHRIVPSAPVIPQDDPTLLFTNAGMNQFKDVFLGLGTREYKRAADVQKCIRVSGKHNDLEEVGRDTYHHTFFEMLGNWSFGDYYKREAIEWAWELLVEEWKLPREALWATVFEEDDEAAALWPQVTDMPAERVLRFGYKENFWEMGDTGPCGPCTEIHIDRGPEFCDKKGDPSHVCGVNGGCARFIELWNLVFIQFNRDEKGQLHELPAKHVDTGAGLERLVAVLQGKASNYDTDLFQPIIERTAELSRQHYTGGFSEVDVAFRVVADHIRALAFAIADGALPSNEGRGYVLRRILRRAARFGRVLGMHEPFLYRLTEPLIAVMGEAYPELKERRSVIERVLFSEEEAFGRTLDRGLEIFEEKAQEVLAHGETVLPGEVAFLLHDTYGFPLDLTQLMAREKGLAVDEAGFHRLMAEQRERSQKAAAFVVHVDQTFEEATRGLPPTEFLGYELDEAEARVLKVLDQRVILDRTPFYAEAGGQVGDTGVFLHDGREYRVRDTQKVGQLFVHIVDAEDPAELCGLEGKTVLARIDAERRRATERNHTATHLLHKALRTVLGEHAAQSGSLVHPDYFRFDFHHFEKMRAEELAAVEEIVNRAILANYPVRWRYLPFEEARRCGAVALFGEKYGDIVRMVEVDDFSRELCGGTHVRATGEIGLFRIVAESSVAAGIRRIEAVTGLKALELAREDARHLADLQELLNCGREELRGRVEALLAERKELERRLRQARAGSERDQIRSWVKQAPEVNGLRVVARQVEVSDVDELKQVGDVLREELGSGVGVLAAVMNGKASVVCVVTSDLVGKGLRADVIVREVAALAGGGGGGRAHMAMAGIRDLSKLEQVLSSVPEVVRKLGAR